MTQQAESLTNNPLQEYQHLMISQVPDTCNGFFQGNPFLHARQPLHTLGIAADPLPQQLWQNDWVIGILLLCFALIVYIICRAHQALKYQSRAFFFPPQSTLSAQPQPRLEFHVMIVAHLSLCLSAALLYFAFVQAHSNLFLLNITPPVLYLLYVACFICYFLFKYICAACINHIFFTEAQRTRWHDTNALLICTETLCAFILCIILIFSGYSFTYILIAVLCLLALSKTLLAFKCLTIFFNRFYLILHLFAYLCTLEIVPLLALWKTLANIMNILTLN